MLPIFRRFVNDDELFERLIESSEKAPDSYYRLGGNAPVIALRLAKEGAKVLLAARQNPYLMSNILPNVIGMSVVFSKLILLFIDQTR